MKDVWRRTPEQAHALVDVCFEHRSRERYTRARHRHQGDGPAKKLHHGLKLRLKVAPTLSDVVGLVADNHSDEAALGQALQDGTSLLVCGKSGTREQVDHYMVSLVAVGVKVVQTMNEQILVRVFVLVAVVSLETVFGGSGAVHLVHGQANKGLHIDGHATPKYGSERADQGLAFSGRAGNSEDGVVIEHAVMRPLVLKLTRGRDVEHCSRGILYHGE